MAFKKDTQIKAWSFSRYNVYKQCSLKAKLKFIDKLPEPVNEAMIRGGAIHDKSEGYIKLPGRRKLPDELIHFSELFKSLRKQNRRSISGMVVEETWAFTKDWVRTTWDDWKNCWVRIKLDTAWHEDEEGLIVDNSDIMVVNDWKTGKFREDNVDDYIEQLDLYALAALLIHPHIELVKPRLSYLDHGIVYPNPSGISGSNTFTRKDIPRLKKSWAKRVQPMLNDKRFAPRPNNFCNWCHFRKDNGGSCKF